jgi:hypothetical protein
MKPLADYSDAELERDIAICFPVMVSDIKWEAEPEYRIEEIDLLGLTPMEIERVAFLMQIVLRDMRQLVHVAVEQLAVISRERDTARRQLAEFRRR